MKLYTRISSCVSLLWQFTKVSLQVVYGLWRISKLSNPIVTIFGGVLFKEHDFYARQANRLGAMLRKNDISVITGGGAGIMEAASCGAYVKTSWKGAIIGIGVRNLKEEMNLCADEQFKLNYFFARKWLLTSYSKAFIVFPGGFGTLNELSEVLMLIQTQELPPAPIILIGTEFWEEFLIWTKDEALAHGLISAADLALFTITDDLEDALKIILDTCKLSQQQ